MQPSGASVVGNVARPTVPSAVADSIATLKVRADFLKAAKAKHLATNGFVLQARKRGTDENPDIGIRIGYTCSKKVGNAVARNRAKRRLREIAMSTLPTHGATGWDYVLIGRAKSTATLPLPVLIHDLKRALERVHQGPK